MIVIGGWCRCVVFMACGCLLVFEVCCLLLLLFIFGLGVLVVDCCLVFLFAVCVFDG